MGVITYAKAPSLKIIPREHFWVSGLKRAFDLSAIMPLYLYVLNNLEKIERNKDLEITIGSSTIVYQVNKKDDIQLITGWVGNRKSENFYLNKNVR
ncbi:hypothetical protein [Aliarcobacter butzleri]|uniref:hypothetical protein n=1 Tax=Aliarcobacter butzleri TaxID=28197 RepID=UPI0021B59965|nr:hypothetical protein [Aliarcobacter butzleri]MCT7591516.1 hypothetical protein [Aliarcobacter butzleri]MDN5061830.1 hypothetical protein [Aliarcobacter butzleri]